MFFALLLACAPHEVTPARPSSASSLFSSTPRIPDLDGLPRIETDSGLVYVVLRDGNGAMPEAGQTVNLHYNGWLAGGELFDSSYRRGMPFSYKVATGVVIPGFDEAVRNMKVGERRVVIIPPNLGYGAAGAGGMIPPNATLVFELELLSVE